MVVVKLDFLLCCLLPCLDQLRKSCLEVPEFVKHIGCQGCQGCQLPISRATVYAMDLLRDYDPLYMPNDVSGPLKPIY